MYCFEERTREVTVNLCLFKNAVSESKTYQASEGIGARGQAGGLQCFCAVTARM